MATKKRVPEIRFQGFSGEWEKKTFSEFGNVRRGLTYKPSDVSREGIKVLRSSNIDDETFVQWFDDVFVIESSINIDYAQDNDILITSANGSSRLVGKHAIISNLQGRAVHGGFMLLATTKQPQFVNALMSANWYSSFINLHVSGGNGSIGNLSRRALVEQEVIIPPIPEQHQIGCFFQKLDTQITLHKGKLSKLGAVKKAMLEKMFPREGTVVPEIRFQGFAGKWERMLLGDIMEISSAARVHKNEWTQTGVPFFRSSDVVAAYQGDTNSKAFISVELYQGLSKQIGRVKQNDLLVTGGGTIGIPYLIQSNEPLYFKDADLLWLKTSELINGRFLYTYLTTTDFRFYLNSITHIGTISHYTIEQAKATPITLPSAIEQQKIATFFTQPDSLISLQQRELDKLKNIKQACLQKMFV